MNDFQPDKNKEAAIEAILASCNYVVIVETDLEKSLEKPDEEPQEYTFFYSSFIASKGLIDFAKKKWKEGI